MHFSFQRTGANLFGNTFPPGMLLGFTTDAFGIVIPQSASASALHEAGEHFLA